MGCDYNEVNHPADDNPADYHGDKTFDSSLLAQALPFLSLDEVFIFGLEGRFYPGSGIFEFYMQVQVSGSVNTSSI